MKNLIVLAVLAIALFSCKTERYAVNNRNAGLIGKWDLVVYSGGFMGGIHYPTSPETIEFTADSMYTRYKGGAVTIQGNYHVSFMAAPGYTSNPKDSVITYGSNLVRQIFEIKSRDTLFTTDYGISDGFNYKYIRHK